MNSALPRVLRRTLLFTPGHRRERMLSAATTHADALVFDWEDGVPAREKPAARRHVHELLTAGHAMQYERIVRINRVGSAELAEDLRHLPLGAVDALLVPKVEKVEELAQLEQALAAREAAASLARPLSLILTLETPRGVLDALALATASSRCSGLFFGAGDYTLETGAAVTPAALQWARSTIVAAAAAAGCGAIDAPHFDVKDVDGTRADAAMARELGFAGKAAFHPLQIAPIHDAMSPTPAQLERARRMLEAFEAMQADGRNVAIVDGEIVAVDMIPRQRHLLWQGEEIGRRAAARS